MKPVKLALKAFFNLIFIFLLFSPFAHAELFQAENYDEAFDTSPGNAGGAFRGGDVDIEPTSDIGGGFNVGWIDAGEWLVFHNFTVPVTGNYLVSLRVASISGATASVDLNAGTIPLGNFPIPATGGWQNWTTVSRIVALNAGTYNLGIFAQTNGWNLNWVEIIPQENSSSSSSSSSSSRSSSSSSDISSASSSLASSFSSNAISSSLSSNFSSLASSSSSSVAFSSSSSLGITDEDRSLLIHDEATLQAADFSLRSTLQQLVTQLNEFNPGHPTSADELFARMWDTQNPAPGLVSGGEKCTGTLNGFAVACRQLEGQQASDPQGFIAKYQPIALVNRFDLRDTISFTDCGEYRIIYALIGFGFGERNFIIFESQLPNPQPGIAAGCAPVAQFWQGLSAENDATARAQALRNFYFNGLTTVAPSIGPVIDFRNYSTASGQIRANMFMGSAWNLKEFKIDIDAQGLSVIKAVTDKSNPVNFLFNASSGDARVQQFQNDFIANLNSLLGDFNSFTLTVANDQHNRGESFASSAMAADSILSAPFFDSANDSFRQAVENKLNASGSNLTTAQTIARATAMTCAGCHAPASFGLTQANAIGPNQRWPDTLGFTHVNEVVSGGVFPLSPALTDVFLPARKIDFRSFLTLMNRAVIKRTATLNSFSSSKLTPTSVAKPANTSKPADAPATSSPGTTVTRSTKRSG